MIHKDKKTILIADDEDVCLEILAILLENHGYNVLKFSDGLDAYNYLLESEIHPFLFIIDLLMPKMDGYSFLEETKKIPKINNIPVIVQSGVSCILNAKDDPKRVLYFMEKPYNPANLLDNIKKIETSCFA